MCCNRNRKGKDKKDNGPRDLKMYCAVLVWAISFFIFCVAVALIMFVFWGMMKMPTGRIDDVIKYS